MQISIRQATPQDIDAVAEILGEAAHWLEQQGMPMWHKDELQPNRIVADVDSGQFYLAEVMVFLRALSDSSLKTVCSGLMSRSTTQRSFIDSLCEDVLPEEKFLRLSFFGPLLVHTLGLRYLRLDCEASRARLRTVYERIGFQFHSNKQVGPYFVARYEYDVREISPSKPK